jgi:hypothetical protein
MSGDKPAIPTFVSETPRVVMGRCGQIYITVAKNDLGRIEYIDLQGKDLRKDCMLWARATIRQAVHKLRHGANVERLVKELMQDDTPCSSDSSALMGGYRSCLYAMCQVMLDAERKNSTDTPRIDVQGEPVAG